MTVDSAATTQIAPASRHAKGAIRSSMKCVITKPTLIAAITMTAMVETIGANIGCENHQVDAAVLTISNNQTAMTEMTAAFTSDHLTRYSSGNRQTHSRSTMCQYVAPPS